MSKLSFVEKLRLWSKDEIAHPANLRKVIGEAADYIEELENDLEDKMWAVTFNREDGE